MKKLTKFRFIETTSDVDSGNVPFCESDNQLGPKIQQAIKQVWDGTNCPYFAHFLNPRGGECGFIVVTSFELFENQIHKAFAEWEESIMSETIEDDDVFEYTVEV